MRCKRRWPTFARFCSHAVRRHWPLNLIAGSFFLILAAIVYCDSFAPAGERNMELLCAMLVFSSAFMVGAVPVTVLLCRHRINKKLQHSCAMILSAASIATVLTMLSGCLILDGSDVLTVGYWVGDWPTVRRWLMLWPWGFAVSALVAFAILVHYRRRSNWDETHTTQSRANLPRSP